MRAFTEPCNEPPIDHRLQEEIEQHLALQAEENVRAGMSPREAMQQAILKFGSVQAVREDWHDEEGLPLVEGLLQDLQYAVRILFKSPALALAAVMTLALGIGANTTVFSVVDAVLLRPLPYMQPERLVEVESFSSHSTSPSNISYPDFLDWRAQNRTFNHLVSYHDGSYTLTGVPRAVHIPAEVVSWDLLPMLGLYPTIGRGFAPDEEKRGTRVVLLSHELWESEFGANKAVLGRTIQLSGETFTVIGVMPANFAFRLQRRRQVSGRPWLSTTRQLGMA